MMTEPGDRRRRSRRAVRAPGPVGQENRALLSRLPAPPREPTPSSMVTERPGNAGTPRDPAVAFRSQDDSDLGWGPGGDDSNDDRLRQDKPPHW